MNETLFAGMLSVIYIVFVASLFRVKARCRNQKGFTAVELVVVGGILPVLAVLAVAATIVYGYYWASK